MRDFKGSADDFAVGGAGGVTGVSWPVFKYYFIHDFCLSHAIILSSAWFRMQ